jgi:hypothetical protein
LLLSGAWCLHLFEACECGSDFSYGFRDFDDRRAGRFEFEFVRGEVLREALLDLGEALVDRGEAKVSFGGRRCRGCGTLKGNQTVVVDVGDVWL